MKRLLVLCSILLAAPAQAGQEWELISVTRGPTWEVNEAKGALKQNGRVLEGVLKDKTDGKADYRIRVELDGGHAQATFRFISENDEGTKLTGMYKRTAKPTKTGQTRGAAGARNWPTAGTPGHAGAAATSGGIGGGGE